MSNTHFLPTNMPAHRVRDDGIDRNFLFGKMGDPYPALGRRPFPSRLGTKQVTGGLVLPSTSLSVGPVIDPGLFGGDCGSSSPGRTGIDTLVVAPSGEAYPNGL